MNFLVMHSLKPKTYFSVGFIFALFIPLISAAAVVPVTVQDSQAIPETSAVTASQSLALLDEMKQAVEGKNYQVSIVSQEKGYSPNSLKYSHAKINNQSYAHLLYLDGPSKEVILHNNVISYLQPDSVSFSLSSPYIFEAFPNIVYSNFKKIAEFYNFVFVGKARTANRSCQLIRIMAKDKDRFSYLLWIDDSSYLPLRIDLFDLDANLITQMKVIDIAPDFNVQAIKQYVDSRNYPILLAVNNQPLPPDEIKPNWLPKGFTQIATSRSFYDDVQINTWLYSDGVFSFTINSSIKRNDAITQIVQQGGRSVVSTVINNREVTIIGDLPSMTIEHIAKNIVVSATQ